MEKVKFSKADLYVLLGSFLILLIGFLTLAYTSELNGIAALWVAPVLLVVGFLLPVLGLVGVKKARRVFERAIVGAKANPVMMMIGGFIFLVAFVVYQLTLSPDASLWDCPEFISAAYKLQVPHMPGTPLFLLLARLFMLLSFGNELQAAYWMNTMSAFSAALGAFLFYHLIWWLLRKKFSSFQAIFSAAVSALILAFLDTYWYSAVESEVYATATCYLIFLIWLTVVMCDTGRVITWRKIILLGYLLGLGYSIHPMCLMALPIVVVFTFQPFPQKPWLNWITSFATGTLVLLLVNKFLGVGIFELALALDMFLVNDWHAAEFTGVWVLAVILFLSVTAGLKFLPNYTQWLYPFVFLFLGFFPYLTLFIRSAHNPVMDQHNPENLPNIVSYMKRESYGNPQLFYGPLYTAQPIDIKTEDVRVIWDQENKTYKEASHKTNYVYADKDKVLLPRMNRNEDRYINRYEQVAGLKRGERPTFSHNIKYLLKHQLGTMYFRYLLWNFAGRLGDQQGAGWLKPSHWFDGVVEKEVRGKAYNNYWMLPLILGFLGMFFQYNKDSKAFFMTLTFFLITGVVLVFYLNAPPIEPRERDYIYVGSFVAFTVWVAYGVLAVANWVFEKNRLANSWGKPFVGLVGAVLVVLVFVQNYNDHDRSGRKLPLEYARYTLESCEPNAILLTGGDNDTFPLWYLQEVEGVRTDVRVVVLSYFRAAWMVEQLTRPAGLSAALPISFAEKDYYDGGSLDYAVLKKSDRSIDVAKLVEAIKSRNPQVFQTFQGGNKYVSIPGNMFSVSAEQAELSEAYQAFQKPFLTLKAKGNSLYKNDLILLDILQNNQWKRPIYFNYTSLNSMSFELKSHCIQEGNIYKLLPIEVPKGAGYNTVVSYKHLIEENPFSSMQKGVFWSYEDHFLRIITPLRYQYAELSEHLLKAGEKEKARQVLEIALEKVFPKDLPYGATAYQIAMLFKALGDNEQALSLLAKVEQESKNQLSVLDPKKDRELYGYYHSLLNAVR